MKKSLITILSVVLLLSLVGTVACQAIPDGVYNGGSNTVKSNPQQLEILDGSLTYTQDQKLSKIKAENLIKNNGYKDSDEVTVIVTLDGSALIDDYLSESYGYGSVAEYAACSIGASKKVAIADSQDALVYKMKSKGLVSEIVGVYSTLLNAVAVRTTYGKIDDLKSLGGVKNVILTDTYNKPQSTSTSGSGSYNAVDNIVDVYEKTGIYKSDSVGYTGKKTAVAVLDSGFDCSHEVFQRALQDGELAITREEIVKLLAKSALQNVKDPDNDGKYVYNKDGTIKQEMLPLLNAAKYTSGVTINDLYYSNKIPFVYDYADKDTNVFPYDSEHGTHVAGIIGGNIVDGTQIKDEEPVDFRGVAIDTQLVLMKVFPDLDAGANTADILLALEDAVELGVDAINMSLGSSCGFSREADKVEINDVYDKIKASGISLVTAASNSYSSGFGGDQGNTNFTTNPDSGTVGSPSTYDASLSVASISGVKSNYIVANQATSDKYIFFYNQSNSITGEQNNFVKELVNAGRMNENETKTFGYVTVPGTGSAGSFAMVASKLKGKIAIVKRGDNTFENKAMLAKRYGAIACIIYNNVDGDILMSMGKTEHIPTISISKDDGTVLASRREGTLTICSTNLAGPFMSDFSSWGPTPDLKLKPEITAHGGEIYSSVPNGGYDRLSGTSMASPNLCGIIVLIRDYVKSNAAKFGITETNGKPDPVQVNDAVNQLLMSTATVALNEEGNPYSPRKQGAGLASAKNVVNTNAYLTVNQTAQDGTVTTKTKTKLELGDDPKRSGVYVMEFNVVNVGENSLTYNVNVVGMTESVSTSDNKHVAEKGNLLDGSTTLEVIGGEGSVNNGKVTVSAGKTVTVRATYTLSEADKTMIDLLFKYGMYVEGYVELTAENEVPLNIPFLAFYGNWAEAPLFDKTYYEVESTKHDKSVDEEDKIKADYWATTPYGSYYYNYMIPLGTYLYDVDSNYDEIPASTEHIAVSNILGTVDGISAVYAGLLRNAKEMTFSITDKTTGETVWTETYYNCHKAFSNGGSPVPYYEFIKVKSLKAGLVNNRQYSFRMQGLLDYSDNGLTTNVRNSFGFDFYMDNQAPVIKEATYEKVYDKSANKDRYYVNLTIYDNHYAMSVAPVIFTSSSSYTYLSENPIPVYSDRNSDTTVRIEITDYLDDLYSDTLINNALAFIVDDYALNSNIYLCRLPGTSGEFKFTSNGEADGADKILLSMYAGESVDVTKYLYCSDQTKNIGEDTLDRTYLKHLTWSSSNEDVLKVEGGVIKAIAPGKATVTVKEKLDGASAVLIVNVKTPGEVGRDDDLSDDTVEKLRFTYYDTLFAYSRAAQTSEIGTTGDRRYVAAQSGLSVYPGESVDMHYEFRPWYAESKYADRLVWETDNDEVAKVEKVVHADGTVTGKITALKEGIAQITLKVDGTAFETTVAVTVKSEFVIENRTLVAYKGLGGNVVIPDDEGILYIGSYAFCLYTTDNTIELPDDDYDANKIPASNTSVTSVVVPDGVTEIQKYAFYNCMDLREVAIPDGVKYIREYAFYGCKKLERVVLIDNLTKTGSNVMSEKYRLSPEVPANPATGAERIPAKFVFESGTTPQSLTGTAVEVIGANAFYNCQKLDNIDLSRVYAIGVKAFDNCKALRKVNLVSLRNTGRGAFQNCSNLFEAVFDENGNTQLANGMFYRSGLTSVDIYSREIIPYGCFSECSKLQTVTIHGDSLGIGSNAFSQCKNLTEVILEGKVDVIGQQAFYNDTSLSEFTLPDGKVSIGDHAFYRSGLTTLVLQGNTEFDTVAGTAFRKSKLASFDVSGSNLYAVDANGFLTTKDGSTIVFAPVATSGVLTIPASVTKIANSAFSGTAVTEVTFEGKVAVGDYAFYNCPDLTKVTFAAESGTTIGKYAFAYSLESDAVTSETKNESVSKLATVINLQSAVKVGDYAFAYTVIDSDNSPIATADGAEYGEGVFFNVSTLKQVTLGADSSYGVGVFQRAKALKTVIMPDTDVTFGAGAFAYDTELNSIDLSHVSVIPQLGFMGCTKLFNVNLSAATTIGNYAFADCTNLATVTMRSVRTIGEGAFGGNNVGGIAARTINLPETLESIGMGAFISCTALEEINIPSKVTDIPAATFALCTSLSNVQMSNVRTIGDNAFKGCTALATINLDNVQSVGEESFRGTTALVNVKMKSMKTIGQGAFYQSNLSGGVNAPVLGRIDSYAFAYSALTSITAPELATIGEGAFNEVTSIRSFTFGDKLAKVESFAFLGCSKLATFNYTKDGKTATDGAINDYAKLVDGVLYTRLANGSWQLTAVPAAKNIETLVVAEGTRRVDAYAGNKNTNVTTIELPVSMRNIGQYAFYGYTSLHTVVFRSIEAPALDDAYNSNAELVEGDPGYEMWNKYFNMFGYYLYYYNFVDLVGKVEPMTMVVPANSGIKGYDALPYRMYFGEIAEREGEAMEIPMRDFLDQAVEIAAIKTVTLGDGDLIDSAVYNYSLVTQNPVQFGISDAEWYNYVDIVLEAKEQLTALRYSKADEATRKVQAMIDALPPDFSFDCIDEVKAVAAALKTLTAEEKSALTTDRYDNLVNAYTNYVKTVSDYAELLKPSLSGSDESGLNASLAGVLLAACVLPALKKRKED